MLILDFTNLRHEYIHACPAIDMLPHPARASFGWGSPAEEQTTVGKLQG